MKVKLPWIFGIGTPKSGSNSLIDALNIMGFNAKHTFGEAARGDRRILDAMLGYRNSLGDLPESLMGIDALADWPVWHEPVWKRLMKEPSSKFIMTYRNPSDAALSWCRQMLAMPKSAAHQDMKNYTQFKIVAERHMDRVFSAFEGNYEKLLILNMSDPDKTKWKLLSKFLDVKVDENQPYPRSFDHSDWQMNENMLREMKEFE